MRRSSFLLHVRFCDCNVSWRCESPVDSFDVGHAVVLGVNVVRGCLALRRFWLLGDILGDRLLVDTDRGMLMFGGHLVVLLLLYVYNPFFFKKKNLASLRASSQLTVPKRWLKQCQLKDTNSL